MKVKNIVKAALCTVITLLVLGVVTAILTGLLLLVDLIATPLGLIILIALILGVVIFMVWYAVLSDADERHARLKEIIAQRKTEKDFPAL